MLWRAGSRALRELGLRWNLWYADEEPETVVDHQAAPGSAYNVRFLLVTDDGRFLNLRLRVAAAVAEEELAAALGARLQRDHLQRIQ